MSKHKFKPVYVIFDAEEDDSPITAHSMSEATSHLQARIDDDCPEAFVIEYQPVARYKMPKQPVMLELVGKISAS